MDHALDINIKYYFYFQLPFPYHHHLQIIGSILQSTRKRRPINVLTIVQTTNMRLCSQLDVKLNQSYIDVQNK